MYFQCCNFSHTPIELPDGVPVIIGRSAETKISDKMCSRNQLQLTANYNQKYVMVKRLGSNPSQIEGIDINHNKTDKLSLGQTLCVVNMKYPHRLVWTGPQPDSEKSKTDHHELDKISSESGRKRKAHHVQGMALKDLQKNESGPPNHEVVDAVKKVKSTHWSQGLRASISDESLQVYKDDTVSVIKDKYPKAKYHWLVMPNENITTTTQLRQGHLSLLKHMLEVGKQVVKENVDSEDKRPKFRYGYHAVASMSHLHMHVISQDFCSPALKTKKHWNSFTTAYFVDAEEIIKDIETEGRVKNRKHMTELLNAPLVCHVCKKSQKNMPELKRHIEKCR